MVKTKKIQMRDLKVGMKIKTKDQARQIIFRTVTDKWDTVVTSFDQVRLEFYNGTILNCSVNHPIIVMVGDELVEKLPHDIRMNDEVVTESGLTKLMSIDGLQNNDVNYLDITVEDTHTFFAANSPDQEMVLTHNSQGGVRNGAATLYYPLWHLEIEDMLVLKNNKGTEDNRVRHMDYGVQFNKLMYERLLQNGNITCFSPSDVPGLYDAFFADQDRFRQLYEAAEKDPKIRKKTFKAIDLFSMFVEERKNTGRIYLLNVDHANTHGAFIESAAPIKMSNLCCLTGETQIEIMHHEEILNITIADFFEKWSLGYYDSTVTVKSWEGDTVVWRPITNAMLTKQTSELMEIETETGQLIRCTPDHKVYTKNRGWVEAQNLEPTDELVIDD